ncbi:hypothetical protein [Lichenicoccus sp.]|uniref:hypothetical protein n=1 Tax=Lichenicoccus sp. TaxID=2781899 RepID=UPI003D0EB6C0
MTPWNKGRYVGAKPPLKPKQIWSIRFHLQRERRVRDLALFDLAVDSKLRGCDLVRLRIGDVVARGDGGAAQDEDAGAVQADRTDPREPDRLARPARGRH